jgi:hypothetical protein
VLTDEKSRDTESVFFGLYRSVFLGNHHTDTIPKENSVGTFSIVDTKKYALTVSKLMPSHTRTLVVREVSVSLLSTTLPLY